MNNIIPSFPHSHITRDDRGIYTLQIHDAKSVNVLASAVTEGLEQAAAWIGAQSDARAVILRGTGDKAFVGGANIFEMAELDPAGARAFISRLRTLCDTVADIPVPTVARIPGLCLGAGMELAAACDIRIGSADSVYGMPEVRIGIPSVIHAALLPGLIGQGATNWLLLTGEHVDAHQALRWGYLQFVSEDGGLDALVSRTVDALAANGPRAVRAQKSLIRHWREASLKEALDRSVEVFGDAFTTDEPARYMAPFLARKHDRGAA